MVKRGWAVAISLLAGSPALATTVMFDDRSHFLASTGAYSLTGELPLLPGAVSVRVGEVLISGATGNLIFVGRSFGGSDWTPLLPGHDIAVQFAENINIALDNPTYAFGFDFVEPMLPSSVDGCGVAVCLDSTFTVTLKAAGVTVDSVTFNAANDIATFVGWWSDNWFDRVEIREDNNSAENEFFGQFYGGVTSAVPAPPAAWTLFAGLAMLAVRRRYAQTAVPAEAG